MLKQELLNRLYELIGLEEQRLANNKKFAEVFNAKKKPGKNDQETAKHSRRKSVYVCAHCWQPFVFLSSSRSSYLRTSLFN